MFLEKKLNVLRKSTRSFISYRCFTEKPCPSACSKQKDITIKSSFLENVPKNHDCTTEQQNQTIRG